jgi:hypothetical protein
MHFPSDVLAMTFAAACRTSFDLLTQVSPWRPLFNNVVLYWSLWAPVGPLRNLLADFFVGNWPLLAPSDTYTIHTCLWLSRGWSCCLPMVNQINKVSKFSSICITFYVLIVLHEFSYKLSCHKNLTWMESLERLTKQTLSLTNRMVLTGEWWSSAWLASCVVLWYAKQVSLLGLSYSSREILNICFKTCSIIYANYEICYILTYMEFPHLLPLKIN